MAVASIYAHFGSLIDRALGLDERYSEEGFDAGNSPLERLVGLAEGYLRFAREHPGCFPALPLPPA